MSNADHEEILTVSSDGVSVEKSFEPDDFPVPAIAFVVNSERDEAVAIRLVDSVPSHVPPEDIGFHPKYGAEYWDVEGDTIVFEREIDPGEEYTTVYGLRGGEADDVGEFLTEPTLEDVDPPVEEGDAGGTVRDVIGDNPTGDSDPDTSDDVASAVGSVDTDPAADIESVGEDETLDDETATVEETTDTDIDLSDPDETDSSTSVDTATDSSTSDDTATDPSTSDDTATDSSSAELADDRPTDENLVTALADEIRSGDVDDEAVEELRDALGVDLASATVEARIEHLQSEVSDLEAYTDALEEFIDENGDAQQLLGDVREDVASTRGRIDDIAATAEAAAESAESVDGEVEALDERIEEFDERIEEFDERIDEFDDRFEDTHERIEEFDDRFEDTHERIEEFDDRIEEFDDRFEEFDDRFDGGIEDDLEEIRSAVEEDTGERLDDMESEIAELSDELEDVAEMRDRLAAALGDLGPQDDDE